MNYINEQINTSQNRLSQTETGTNILKNNFPKKEMSIIITLKDNRKLKYPFLSSKVTKDNILARIFNENYKN